MPSRAVNPSLANTLNDTSAGPWPLAGDNAVIQPTLLDASHAHSRCVVTLSEPVPPTASIIGGVFSTTTHFTGFGPELTVEDVSQLETNSAASRTRAAANDVRRPTWAISAMCFISSLLLGVSWLRSKRHSSGTVTSSQGFARESHRVSMSSSLQVQ